MMYAKSTYSVAQECVKLLLCEPDQLTNRLHCNSQHESLMDIHVAIYDDVYRLERI